MAEPRMRQRQKGQQFPTSDIESLLVAFGDNDPLPSSVSVLDEILTDFIIETCHAAALSASYSRRQKIKVDDFKWVLRRDPKKLGRVAEIFAADRMLKESRLAFKFDNAEDLLGGVGKKGAKGEVAGMLNGQEQEMDLERGGKKRGRKRKIRDEPKDG